jgi:hypothetical protein
MAAGGLAVIIKAVWQPYAPFRFQDMAKKRSSYQNRVIKNYYRNRDAIMLQRLGEMVTDLYLAEGNRRTQLWKRVAGALENLKVSASRIDHVVSSDNPTLLANLLQELMES